ncbi:uncharacterized protein Z519_09794 [Cladophialophora bantiana CBS 173.52]|uniref:Uncharacterized protein n=1 Tax=Cladophialophora bantiana (strain ATCC 10958 / CBS 173.52 / CDC B-1940 / NIH 8579) TaxID=1442370 RepID=A0A0D2H8Q8_CLAB1|nr:uncharacterized protein Z519_09794 [Cladophialophora bantiana CBS 173.52]KIW89638.1 hypothetical protein Z519_09794 [Cladophialophora bantiana CBS 173.52]
MPTCVVDNFTAYEQGAYVVVAAIGCPEDSFPTANATLARVTTDLREGGDPQECEGVENSTVVCNNGTAGGNGTSGEARLKTTRNRGEASSSQYAYQKIHKGRRYLGVEPADGEHDL